MGWGRLDVGVLDNAGGMDDALSVKTFNFMCRGWGDSN